MQIGTGNSEKPSEMRSFIRRIGSTNYRVGVHFSRTSRETANDKIARLVRFDAATRRAVTP